MKGSAALAISGHPNQADGSPVTSSCCDMQRWIAVFTHTVNICAMSEE